MECFWNVPELGNKLKNSVAISFEGLEEAFSSTRELQREARISEGLSLQTFVSGLLCKVATVGQFSQCHCSAPEDMFEWLDHAAPDCNVHTHSSISLHSNTGGLQMWNVVWLKVSIERWSVDWSIIFMADNSLPSQCTRWNVQWNVLFPVSVAWKCLLFSFHCPW